MFNAQTRELKLVLLCLLWSLSLLCSSTSWITCRKLAIHAHNLFLKTQWHQISVSHHIRALKPWVWLRFSHQLICYVSYQILYLLQWRTPWFYYRLFCCLLCLMFSALRTAIQAFRREEDLLMYRASKRRRERFEQVSCVSYQWQNYNHILLSITYKRDIPLKLAMFCSFPSAYNVSATMIGCTYSSVEGKGVWPNLLTTSHLLTMEEICISTLELETS